MTSGLTLTRVCLCVSVCYDKAEIEYTTFLAFSDLMGENGESGVLKDG